MSGPPLRSRWRRVALAVLVAVVALMALGGSPASAHATLVATDPAEGAVLETAPDTVRFTFSESVLGIPDGVKIFDASGSPVASTSSVRGPEVSVALADEVGDGTLVVVWRVLSEDGHPISGSLSFSVGAPSADVATPPVSTAASTDVPWTLTVARGVGYIGLFLAVGLVAFMVLFLRSTPVSPRAGRRLMMLARGGAGAAALAWMIGLPLTAIYQVGGGLEDLARSGTWSVLSTSEVGVAVAVAVGTLLAVQLGGRAGAERRRGGAALVACAVAVGAPALTGHTRAAAPEALAVAADVLHLVAGSVWLGGLVGLVVVLPDLVGRDDSAGELLARFSSAAAGVLAMLVATGALLTWRIVGSWSGLIGTGYGRLLLVKIAMASVAVLIASWNRFVLLPRLRHATRGADSATRVRLVTRATAAEAVVLLAIVLVTGLLVDMSPRPEQSASAAAAESGPKSAMLADVKVLADVEPLVVGTNTVTIALQDSTGAPTELAVPPRARLASDQVDLGDVPLTSEVAGTYTAEVVLPVAGSWRLQVSLRTGAFDNPVTSFAFTVE